MKLCPPLSVQDTLCYVRVFSFPPCFHSRVDFLCVLHLCLVLILFLKNFTRIFFLTTTFGLIYSSSMYSSHGILGMFHTCKTGCDSHVPVADIVTHNIYMYNHVCNGSKLSTESIAHGYTVKTMSHWGRRGRSEMKKVVCNIYSYFKKQAKKGGASTSSLIRTFKSSDSDPY